MNNPELKNKLREWLSEAGLPLTGERIDKIFHGYPLNPSEGHKIVTALHEKGFIGHTLEEWLNSVDNYKVTTTNIPKEVIEGLRDRGTKPFKENVPWIKRVEERPKADRNLSEGFRKLEESLGVFMRGHYPFKDKLSSTNYSILTGVFTKKNRLPDSLRNALHDVVGSTEKSPDAHNVLDKAINQYNEAVFEQRIIRDKGRWANG